MTKVLVVDDNATLRTEIVRLVERGADFSVVGAVGSGEAAVDKASKLQPDVVLMDMLLPGIDGIEATRRILAADPAVIVLVLSNYTYRGAVRKMLDSGARGYLSKDNAFGELPVALQRLVKGERVVGKGIDW